MNSHYNVKPLRLDFKPSMLLLGMLLFVSLSACAIVVFLPVSIAIRASLCLLVVFAAAYQIERHVLLSLPSSCQALVLNAKGELTVITKEDAQMIGVQGSSFVASYLTVLNYRISGEWWSHSIVILPDCVAATEYRRLRVWLRWSRQAVAEA